MKTQSPPSGSCCCDALISALQSHVGQRVSEATAEAELKKHPKQAQFVVDSVEPYVSGSSRQVRLRFYETAWALLITVCRRSNQLPIIANLLSHASSLGVLLEEEFPGYLEGGLAPVLLQALGARKKVA